MLMRQMVLTGQPSVRCLTELQEWSSVPRGQQPVGLQVFVEPRRFLFGPFTTLPAPDLLPPRLGYVSVRFRTRRVTVSLLFGFRCFFFLPCHTCSLLCLFGGTPSRGKHVTPRGARVCLRLVRIAAVAGGAVGWRQSGSPGSEGLAVAVSVLTSA